MSCAVMMVSGPNLNATEINENDLEEEEYSDEDIEEEEEEDEEMEYSDDEIDEFHIELHDPDTPHSFEDFHNMYKPEPQSHETKNSTKPNEPKLVEEFIEKRVTNVPESSPKAVFESPEISHESEYPHEEDVDFEPDDIDEEIDEEEEEEEISGKLFINLKSFSKKLINFI